MARQPIIITVCVCATIIIASGIIARAGDVNPPQGPIAASGPSLSDVFNCAEEILARMPPHGQCRQGSEYLSMSAALGHSVPSGVPGLDHPGWLVLPLLEGSGVLNAMHVAGSPFHWVVVEESDGRFIAILTGGHFVGIQQELTQFDIRYSRGLRLRYRESESVTGFTVFYSPDRAKEDLAISDVSAGA